MTEHVKDSNLMRAVPFQLARGRSLMGTVYFLTSYGKNGGKTLCCVQLLWYDGPWLKALCYCGTVNPAPIYVT